MKNDNKNNHVSIGIDIGGTNMKAVLLKDGQVLDDCTLATPKDNLEHFLIMIKALVDPLLAKAKQKKLKVEGLGFGIAGLIDKPAGKIIKSPNLPWLDGVKIIDRLSNNFDLPIMIDNDANCFLRAEVKLGAVQKYNNIFGLIIGTGLGGALWLDNKIYTGSRQAAGEFGHIIINCSANEPVNKEQIIDLEKIYQKLTQNNPAKLAQEAYGGDILADKTYKEIGHYLGLGLANVVNLIDPEIIVLGGGVAESHGLFLSKLKKTLKEYIINPEAKKIKILTSKLGKNSGAIGAALLVP